MRIQRLALIPALFVLAIPAGVHAEDEEALPAPDVRRVFARMADEIDALSAPPEFGGIEDRLRVLWKRYVKPRVPGARRALDELAQPRRFEVEAATGRFLRVKEDQWTGFVSRLTRAYTTLSTARKGYDRLNTSSKAAVKRWHQAHPEPDLRRQTPSESALAHVRGRIRALEIQGYVVPYHLIRQHNDLVDAAAEERAALLQAHRDWVAARRQAMEDIQQLVALTKRAAGLEQDRFTLQMKNVQVLAATLLEAEEERLAEAVAAFPQDPRVQEVAGEVLPALKRARQRIQGYTARKATEWTGMLRKTWMAPRSRLRLALKGAAQRAARDDAAKEDAATEESGSGAPKEAPAPAGAPEAGDN